MSGDQLPLFSEPGTSREAAESIAPHVARLQARVLDALRMHPGGLTCEQLCDRTHLDGNTVRPRLVELQEMNYIKATDERRRTRSRRSARVYDLTTGALDEHRDAAE